MKKKFYAIYFLVFGIIPLNFIDYTNSETDQPNQIVAARFQDGLVDLEQKIESYLHAAQNLKANDHAIEQLKAIHLEARLSFKSIELFLEYFDHESIKQNINGAPLPSVEPKVPEVRVIEPSGLQTLDELVFSDTPDEAKEEIVALLEDLKAHFRGIKNFQQNISIVHRQIFEAIRQELIRVFTLGITGFDTPGSINALPEALSAFKAMRQAFEPYKEMVQSKDKVLAKKIMNTFESSIQYLEKNNDFDTFDRMHFLKVYINPLYAEVYKAQRALGIETIYETTSRLQSTNYHAQNLFSDDFLEASFYAGIDMTNELQQKRVELGRLLFFDPILSENNERSCASCHHPEKGFTDGLKTSLALDMNGHILRNSPTIVNSVYAEKYFYDLREQHLERQMKHVVMDKKEFNTDFFVITDKLSKSKTYQALFEEAYPKYKMSQWGVSNALTSYVTSIRSFNSPVDQYIRGEQKDIDPAAIRGFNLFMGKAACGTCHFAPTFNGLVPPLYHDSESEVLGVPATKDTLNPHLDQDLGRIANGVAIDEAPFLAHSFKTTTVRNVALTAPYMHNGVYDSLEEVIDFYNKGGGIGLGIDVPYQTLPDAPLGLTDAEKKDLIVFMEHLTDTTNMTVVPAQLPSFEGHPEWNDRVIGGKY